MGWDLLAVGLILCRLRASTCVRSNIWTEPLPRRHGQLAKLLRGLLRTLDRLSAPTSHPTLWGCPCTHLVKPELFTAWGFWLFGPAAGLQINVPEHGVLTITHRDLIGWGALQQFPAVSCITVKWLLQTVHTASHSAPPKQQAEDKKQQKQTYLNNHRLCGC